MNRTSGTALSRGGATSPVVIVLLVGILFALIALILVVSFSGTSPEEKPQGPIAQGTTARRDENAPATAKPVGDPDRVKEVLQEGKTYRAVVKFGFDARAEDKDWGVKQVTNLAYMAEVQVTRKIESNDGHRIVELRTYDVCRNTKVLFQVEAVTIELGTPGVLALGALEYLQPGTTEVVAIAQPYVESILTGATQAVIDDSATRAFAHVDSLSGKSVRITFVDNGVGVESITPLDCQLSSEEATFVVDTAILSDCYILPDVKVKVGQTWTVDGRQFIGWFDPSLRGVPSGSVVVSRAGDEQRGGKQIARLAIERGTIQLDSSDASTSRIGRLTPRGELKYNITDGFVEGGNLTGDLRIEKVSKDHLLFEARYRTEPRLQIQYSCKMIP